MSGSSVHGDDVVGVSRKGALKEPIIWFVSDDTQLGERIADTAAFDDLSNEIRIVAEHKLATLPLPGVFGVFYQSDRPTKNASEKKWIETTREKTGNLSNLELLQKTFDRMK
jgi:hypothetical protein